MSLQSILSNKVRSFLTMLGIIIGVAAVMIMVSVVQGSTKAMQEYYAAMGTNKVSVMADCWDGRDITDDLYSYCLSMPRLVSGVTPNGSVWGTVKYMNTDCDRNEEMYGGPQVYLGSDQFSICNNYTIARGRDISYLDIKRQNRVVVIGDYLREYLFQAQEPLGKTITIGGNSFEVVGVYAGKAPKESDSNTSMGLRRMDYVAVIPYTLNKMMGQRSMSEFTIKAKSSEATTETITRITGFLSGLITQENGWFNVDSEDTWMQENQSETNMMSLVLGGIAGISLLVGGIGIMNIMLVTVTERTREIGIRKAIGGSRRSIILQFLIEASVLCGVGGVFGVILGYLGTLVAGKLILETVLLPDVTLTIGAVAFSVLLGVGFGMYPAVKASGLQPVDALRAD